jgi:hypothetical protein
MENAEDEVREAFKVFDGVSSIIFNYIIIYMYV